MAALQVYLNNKEVCKARHTGVGNVSFHITIDNHRGEEKIDFEINGKEDGNDKMILFDWIIDQRVIVGDEITIKIIDGLTSDEPLYKLDWSPF
jgi:hypothetical protein